MSDKPTTPAKKAAAAKKSAPSTSDASAPPAEHHDSSRKVKAGQIVTWTHFDPYSGAGGEDVTRHGLVVAVDDDGARVFFLEGASDPLPLDDLTVAH